MENIDTEGLIGIQVAQLEKEKKELNERLRIISKRVDHIERAYRRDERPLLAKDYEEQQVNDQEIFSSSQRQRKEESKLLHQANVETKKRLARMLPDYRSRKGVIISKKGEQYTKKQEAAAQKIAEEKEKKKKQVLAAREAEKRRLEEEERIREEEEAEERRLEEGEFFWLLCGSKLF